MRIGVDLGGTNIVAGLVDGQSLIKKVKVACPAKGSQEEVIDAIASLIDQLISDEVESI